MKKVRSIKGLFPEWVLATSLLATWALSVSAISWGLPDGRGWAPDELIPSVVLQGLSTGFSDGWHSLYPPFHFYLLAVVLLPFQIMAHMGLADLSAPETYQTMFLAQRSVSVVLAAATLYLVYLCGRVLHGSRAAGLGAAFLVGSMPVFIYYANIANVDVHYIFWFTGSLLCYILYVTRHHTGALDSGDDCKDPTRSLQRREKYQGDRADARRLAEHRAEGAPDQRDRVSLRAAGAGGVPQARPRPGATDGAVDGPSQPIGRAAPLSPGQPAL